VKPSKPFAFHNLPAEAFPFTIELLDAGTRKVVWTATVDGPGVVAVPGLGPGKRIARVTFPDGTVEEAEA
jgi:hypothetical protein